MSDAVDTKRDLRFGLGALQVVLEGFPDDQFDLLSQIVNHADDRETCRGSLTLRLSRTAARGREIFEDGSPTPTAVCCDEVSLAHLLHRMTARQLALYDDWACLHCGAATIDGRLALFTGDRGSGKTTLLLQLLRDGAAFHCDEYVVVRSGLATTLPRRMHVKPGTLDCLPDVADACFGKPLLKMGVGPRFYAVDPADLGYSWRSRTGRPAAIFHLAPDFDRDPALEPIAQIDMVQRLMYQAISGHRHPGVLASHVCSVVNGVPCFELRVGSLAQTAALVSRTMARLAQSF
jgi:hypothetical protein